MKPGPSETPAERLKLPPLDHANDRFDALGNRITLDPASMQVFAEWMSAPVLRAKPKS